ncbi:ABC transporter permease [Natronincola ferrireducens]|uniref:Peptide/nickel transport system permease protein n=1 Tax=Natronincola ferrireducens TaxID=393762 RepID=A0A1G9E477_9FIRM|nr:ABC transporter permease [Natronincola ferrireducens]SDK70914.1 peptide/nickel transport system permease protein [Natronincola ferrireducens]
MDSKGITVDIVTQQEMILKERKSNNAWNKLKRNKTAMIGLVIVIVMVMIAIFSPFLAPQDPNLMDLGNSYLKPGQNGHILGTDEFGRDLLSRIIYGARISIIVAVGGMLFGGIIGILLGLVAGFKGGIVDTIIMRLMDGMFAFPFVLLAIVLMTVLGDGLQNVILAIGIANIPGFARIVRGQVHIVKNEEYCQAIRALGASDIRLLFAHILPNSISPIIVYATLNVAGAIISEAALSFLGLGIRPPTASWGTILRSGKDYLNTASHIATYSGLAILVTVLGFNLLGDGIRDVLDPKMKR